MNRSDFATFGKLLDSVCAMLSRGTYAPNVENTAMWFRALAAYDIDTVRRAFDAHVKDAQRGRFVPNPADILAQIESAAMDDGRPDTEEAWASCLPGHDENITIVWTSEMRAAWGICLSVLNAGDEVGARMAFKQAYNRLVAEARATRTPTRWHESPGFDPKQRAVAIAEAQRLKRIGLSESLPLLPAPEGEAAAAEQRLVELQAGVGAPPEVREKLAKVRENLTAEATGPTPAQARLEELSRRKAETLAKVVVAFVQPPLPLDTPAAEVLRRLDEARLRTRAERTEGNHDGSA